MGMHRAAALFGTILITGCVAEEPDLSELSSDLDLSVFTLPELSAIQRAEIVHRYDAIDPTNQVPRGLLEDTLVYFDVNKTHIPKSQYVAIADMSLYSGKDRFWLVDLTTGVVEAHKVAHGDGSDPDNNGYATLFGNVDGSHKTSLGFYLTGEIYDGTHVHSMRLDGLSADASPNGMANTNARPRLIVMHEASYVSDSNTSQQGRSNGCLALDPAVEVHMVDRIHDGSLIYTATSALAAPVGRAVCGDGVCDGDEEPTVCAADCADPDPVTPPIDHPLDDGSGNGGCSSTGGGAGLAFALALVGLRRRRR